MAKSKTHNPPQYWLMKSEPHEYSIQDLKNEKHGGRWDGVRNFQARNFLRDSMKVGDMVIFYHSSIKVPAAVGIGKIKGDAYPDPTQFHPSSKYFEPRATKNAPVWVSRDLAFVRAFKREVSIQEMRQNPALSSMLLLKRGQRLSIQPLTEAEFNEIRSMAGE